MRQDKGVIMVSRKVQIKNPTGLHLRPAGELCKEAMLFKSKITFEEKNLIKKTKDIIIHSSSEKTKYDNKTHTQTKIELTEKPAFVKNTSVSLI